MESMESHDSKVLPNEIPTTKDSSHERTYVHLVGEGASEPVLASKGVLQGVLAGRVGFQASSFTQL